MMVEDFINLDFESFVFLEILTMSGTILKWFLFKAFQTHSNKMRDVQKNTALLIANKTAGLLRLSMLEISLL